MITRVRMMKTEVINAMKIGKYLTTSQILNIRILIFQKTIMKVETSLTKCQITLYIRLFLLWRRQINKINVSNYLRNLQILLNKRILLLGMFTNACCVRKSSVKSLN